MSWLRDFTTYKGRLSRSQFLWRHFVLCFFGAFGALSVVLPLSLIIRVEVIMPIVMALIMPPLMYADASLVARRFHDVGLSAWWLALIFLLALIGMALPFLAMPPTWVFVLVLPVNLIYFVILLVVPGTRGPNRFGDPNPSRD